MVLGEACCFHGNQSEINLAMVREELKEKKERKKKRQKERKKINNWYLLLDAWSSWSTTVLPTLARLLFLSYYDGVRVGTYILNCMDNYNNRE